MSRRLTVRPDPGQIAVARDFCAAHLERLVDTPVDPDAVDGLRYDLAMVTSELVTNAIHAGAGRIQVSVEAVADRVRVAVFDDASGNVRASHAAPGATGGRGLMIVDSLSARWGVDVHDDGKTVYADLALPTAGTGSGSIRRVAG